MSTVRIWYDGCCRYALTVGSDVPEGFGILLETREADISAGGLDEIFRRVIDRHVEELSTVLGVEGV